MKPLLAFLGIALLAACSAHSPLIVRSTTDARAVAGADAPALDRPILLLRGPLPESTRYQVLGRVNVGRVWYTGREKVLDQLAAGGRRLGADAVIHVVTWRQPSGWSWASPHGAGTAVRIEGDAGAVLSGLEGDRR